MKKYYVISNAESSTGTSYILPYNEVLGLFQYGSVKNAMRFFTRKIASDFLKTSLLLDQYEYLSIVPIYTKQ